MKRVSDPEIRKKQILETAMRLFYERGYDSTSLEDIAGELHVVKSLCYRYYDSKQTLFDAVLGEYTEECCRDLAEILHDRARPMEARMQTVLEHLIEPAENGRYHDFFHKTGNEAMHEQLAMKMCAYLLPHVTEELENAPQAGGGRWESPRVLAQFLLYGLIGVWQEEGESPEVRIRQFRALAETLLCAGEAAER